MICSICVVIFLARNVPAAAFAACILPSVLANCGWTRSNLVTVVAGWWSCQMATIWALWKLFRLRWQCKIDLWERACSLLSMVRLADIPKS